jgi:pilus assembly protein CpaB
MRYTWSFVILGFLGIAAALCAAVLVVALKARPLKAVAYSPAADVRILVAAEKLPAMTVVNAGAVQDKMVPRTALPEGYLTDSSQIIGKVLALPVEQGQPLTKRLFPTEGSGFELAGMLPPGKRAVSVSLPEYSGLEGILYPGSIVDVMAAFDLKANNKYGSAVSTTLLENVQVLAVEDLTVTADKEEPQTTAQKDIGKRGILVTLMVDPKQAEALQLAMEHGSVSLAMRNPLDSERSQSDATLLSEGQLARLADVMAADVEEAAPAPAPVLEPEVQQPEPELQVAVYRGTVSETVTFKLGAGR